MQSGLIPIYWLVSTHLFRATRIHILIASEHCSRFVRIHSLSAAVTVMTGSLILDSATTGMLAILGFNPLAQVAAFCSIVNSLSSVLCGMLLIFTHRGRTESTGLAAVSFLVQRGSVI